MCLGCLLSDVVSFFSFQGFTVNSSVNILDICEQILSISGICVLYTAI